MFKRYSRLVTEARQLYHLKLDGGRCELAAPDDALSRYIDYYWLLTIDEPALVLEVIPDTAIDLVTSPDIPDFAALYFPVARPWSLQLQGPIHYAGVCFRSASVVEILGLSLSALGEMKIGIDTLQSLTLRPLVSDIQHVTSLAAITEKFDNFWRARLEGAGKLSDKRIRVNHQQMIAALEDTMGSGSIAHVSATLGVSERQFRRLSVDLFGLSPKKLQNILRLQRALEELFECEPGQLQDLYYDDSHRIRELKRLTSCTPGQIRKLAETYNNS